jgi:hypothetical protein
VNGHSLSPPNVRETRFECILRDRPQSSVQRCNQVEAQPKPFAPVAVALRQNAKDFHAADYVFHHELLPGKLTVLLLLLFTERVPFAPFVGCLAIGMEFGNPQIATVCEALGLRQQRRSALAKQLEIMLLAVAERRR